MDAPVSFRMLQKPVMLSRDTIRSRVLHIIQEKGMDKQCAEIFSDNFSRQIAERKIAGSDFCLSWNAALRQTAQGDEFAFKWIDRYFEEVVRDLAPSIAPEAIAVKMISATQREREQPG